MFCRECGNEVKEKAVVCVSCGVAIDKDKFGKGRKSSKPYFAVVLAMLNIFSVIVNSSLNPHLITNDVLWGNTMLFSTPSIILGIICVSKDYSPKKVGKVGLALGVFSFFLNIAFLQQ